MRVEPEHDPRDGLVMTVEEAVAQAPWREREPLWLHLGANAMLLRWYVNFDITPRPGLDIVADFCKGLTMVPDGTVDQIFMAHVLEHIPWRVEPGIAFCLKDWLRVLAPDGRLHIASPNFEFLAMEALRDARYIPQDTDPEGIQPKAPYDHYEDMMITIFSEGDPEKYSSHRWGITYPYLIELLKRHGFRNVRKVEPWTPAEVSVEAWK